MCTNRFATVWTEMQRMQEVFMNYSPTTAHLNCEDEDIAELSQTGCGRPAERQTGGRKTQGF
uniref:Uncharacterized protein n=1 Tax=Anguilla anguilla TaxID=7936 RepID=A0A0E9R1W8_ANGAN